MEPIFNFAVYVFWAAVIVGILYLAQDILEHQVDRYYAKRRFTLPEPWWVRMTNWIHQEELISWRAEPDYRKVSEHRLFGGWVTFTITVL